MPPSCFRSFPGNDYGLNTSAAVFCTREMITASAAAVGIKQINRDVFDNPHSGLERARRGENR